MSTRPLHDLLIELHRRLAGRDPDDAVVAELHELEDGYALSEDHVRWLTAALDAVLAGREEGKALIPTLKGAAGFLSEVSALIPGWTHDDQGEWVSSRFPALGMELHLRRDAVGPDHTTCASWLVRRLPSP